MSQLTGPNVRRMTALLDALRDLKEWWDDTIAKEPEGEQRKYPNIIFGEISASDAKDQHRQGWDGILSLPRDVVEAMMEAGKEYVRAELSRLGVDIASDPPPPKIEED